MTPTYATTLSTTCIKYATSDFMRAPAVVSNYDPLTFCSVFKKFVEGVFIPAFVNKCFKHAVRFLQKDPGCIEFDLKQVLETVN